MIRLAILITVIFFLMRVIGDAREQLVRHKFSLSQIRPFWLFVSAILYLAGLFPMGVFWHKLLVAMGQRPRLGDTMRAYYAGHLGKYVPGKAMVIIIRADMLRASQVDVTVCAVSIFAETLTMMAAGAFVATAMIAWQLADQREFLVVAIVLMLISAFPTCPPVFRWLVKFLDVSVDRLRELREQSQKPGNDPAGDIASAPARLARGRLEIARWGYSWSVMRFGWIANIVGWLVLGLSLQSVLHAIVGAAPVSESAPRFVASLASVTLATVAGFLSLLPGGVLVRELVIQGLLAPHFGTGVAIISAILLRVVWLFAELTCAVILQLTRRLHRHDSTSTE
jgi:hypothetical protein